MSSIKPVIKRILNKALPGLAGEIHALRDKQQIQRVEQRLGLKQISQQFVAKHGLSVMSGPFQGMSYVAGSVGSAYIPKLLGSYEMELHEIIAQSVTDGFDTVVDVGCAEGYYAVGLARLMPNAEVFAFDTAAGARKLCSAMAEANGVSTRVSVRGACTPKHLNDLLKRGNSLIICDCEGYEYQLLQPSLVPGLERSTMLVELHPQDGSSDTQLFLETWKTTHEVKLITSVFRNPDDFPQVAFLSIEQRKIAVDELRSKNQEWAFISPRIA